MLKRDCRFRFANLFDTMICAQLLGYPAIGLAAIAERHFDVRLPKDEQRSDWSARPLRDTQLRYAAADVAHLIPLAERLERELKKAKRIGVGRAGVPRARAARVARARVRQARLPAHQGRARARLESLSVLRELYLVRDRRAREIDRPAFKVLGNRTLLEVAQRRPANERELAEMKGVTELILRRFGRDILGAVRARRQEGARPDPAASRAAAAARRRMDRARRAAPRGAEALALGARARAGARPRRALPEHRARGDRVRRPGDRARDRAAPRGEALVRASLRRRGDRSAAATRGAADVEPAPEEEGPPEPFRRAAA